MDTNVLKTFIAVCEYSGFSAAAKELGYTQSTVSSQIKQLEKELDVRLFDRSYHKINLTEKGVLVLQQARNILKAQAKMFDSLNSAESIEGEIRLSMSSSVCSRYFKNDFLRFHHQYPKIKVEITENGTEQMFDKLRKNETDLVFTLDRHIYDSDFISEKYVKDGQIKRLDVAGCPVTVWTQLLLHKNKWRSPAINVFIEFYKEVMQRYSLKNTGNFIRPEMKNISRAK